MPLTPGAVALRTGALLRHGDGTYARWTAYRVTTGRAEASSRLAFDQALSRRDHDDPAPG